MKITKIENNHCVKSVRIRSFFLSVFSPNTKKYGPEKLGIRTSFMQWICRQELLRKAKSTKEVLIVLDLYSTELIGI